MYGQSTVFLLPLLATLFSSILAAPQITTPPEATAKTTPRNPQQNPINAYRNQAWDDLSRLDFNPSSTPTGSSPRPTWTDVSYSRVYKRSGGSGLPTGGTIALVVGCVICGLIFTMWAARYNARKRKNRMKEAVERVVRERLAAQAAEQSNNLPPANPPPAYPESPPSGAQPTVQTETAAVNLNQNAKTGGETTAPEIITAPKKPEEGHVIR